MTTISVLNLDLKPSTYNRGPLDIDRVWTICELIAHRQRGELGVESEDYRRACRDVAKAIYDVRKAWEAQCPPTSI